MSNEQQSNNINGTLNNNVSIERPKVISLERIHKIETSYAIISTSFKALIIIITIIAGLGGWRLITLSGVEYKLKRETGHITSVLVESLKDKIDDLLNQLVVAEQPPEQEERLYQIVIIRDHINDLKPDLRIYKELSSLIDIFVAIIDEKDNQEAYELSEKLCRRKRNDTYIYPRSLVLKSLLKFSLNRLIYDEEIEQNLHAVIKNEGSIAVAFNLLGVLYTNKASELARDTIKEEAIKDTIIDLLAKALRHFEIAKNLDPSAIGMYRSLNNNLWTKAVFTNAYLDGIIPKNVLIRRLNVNDIDEFFVQSEFDIKMYEELSRDLNLAISLETKAQLYSVESRYRRSENYKNIADSKAELSMSYYLQAIKRGLFSHAKTTDIALSQFKEDRLLEGLRQAGYEPVIDSVIENWCEYNLEK